MGSLVATPLAAAAAGTALDKEAQVEPVVVATERRATTPRGRTLVALVAALAAAWALLVRLMARWARTAWSSFVTALDKGK
jgi:hypothetical protein